MGWLKDTYRGKTNLNILHYLLLSCTPILIPFAIFFTEWIVNYILDEIAPYADINNKYDDPNRMKGEIFFRIFMYPGVTMLVRKIMEPILENFHSWHREHKHIRILIRNDLL